MEIKELEKLRDKYLAQENIARQNADRLAGAAAAINELIKSETKETQTNIEEIHNA